jgi:hypothetical protein
MFQLKVVEKLETDIFYSMSFFENRDIYLIIWQNIVERGRPQSTIWRICSACWIIKATNTHSRCVILFAFPLQQWLHERTSMLCYTYISFIVFTVVMKLYGTL